MHMHVCTFSINCAPAWHLYSLAQPTSSPQPTQRAGRLLHAATRAPASSAATSSLMQPPEAGLHGGRLSYVAMDDLMHQGVADLLDRLRTEELGLPAMKHGQGYAHYYVHHKTPFTYAFSPCVAPKPRDWGSHIDVVSCLG